MNKWILTIVLLTGYLWTDIAVAGEGQLTGRLVEFEIKKGVYACGPLALENFDLAVKANDVGTINAMMEDNSCEYFFTDDGPQHGQVLTGVVKSHRTVTRYSFNKLDHVVVLIKGKQWYIPTKFIFILPEGKS